MTETLFRAVDDTVFRWERVEYCPAREFPHWCPISPGLPNA